MLDAQKETRQAVAYDENGAPCLELAADELIYPITTIDESFKLLCHMKPYDAYAVKRFYDQITPRRKRRTESETQTEMPDYADARAFVLDRFISFEGAKLADGNAPSVEQQRAWLGENNTFTERIFTRGYDRVGPTVRDAIGAKGTNRVILMFGAREIRIPLEIRLYSPDKMVDEVTKPIAILDALTESDRHQYEKSLALIENSRRGESYLEANWDVIELLCNQRLKRIERAVVEGEPCVEANKADWIKLVPFIYKIYVISQAFQDVALKNG